MFVRLVFSLSSSISPILTRTRSLTTRSLTTGSLTTLSLTTLSLTTLSLTWFGAGLAEAQSIPDATPGQNWRSPGAASTAPLPAAAETDEPVSAATPVADRLARSGVRRGSGILPNDHGQIWREYDISAYTERVAPSAHPHQAIVDWILRDTGYEAWHSDVIAILSANPRSLRVYHTPDMHRTVANIVDRYVTTASKTCMYGLKICTVGHPDWRARAQKILEPVPVQTAGVEAWLVAREDAPTLKEDLGRRSDFRQHGSPRLLVNNGQNTVINFNSQRPYMRSRLAPTSNPTVVDSNVDQISEGVTVELNPLLSLDGMTVDAMIKCNVDQVEKLVSVRLESPSTTPSGRQWYNIDVPQTAACRFHERFRWPKDKVLVVSMGMVPRPLPHFTIKNPLKIPLPKSPPRGDMLIFVEYKGDAVDADSVPGGTAAKSENFRGRY